MMLPALGGIVQGVITGRALVRGSLGKRRSPGRSVYAPRRRLPEIFVSDAGRHSLLIYIVHQLVILAALYVLGLMKQRLESRLKLREGRRKTTEDSPGEGENLLILTELQFYYTISVKIV